MLKSSVQSGKISKVLVCGGVSCGKTAILEQLIYGNHSPSQAFPTIEDAYPAHIDNDRGSKERMVLYDTGGLSGPNPEVSRAHLSHSDAFVLIYAVDNPDSFRLLDAIKRDIDRHKEKKEVVFLVLGNKCDLPARKVDFSTAHAWAQREKVKLFEVSALDRKQLIEPFIYLSSKLNPPSNKSSFPPLRSKGKAGNFGLEL